jgi:hypothetical protein
MLARWALRGSIAALLLFSVVLAVGWATPLPEAELRPWAIKLALPVWLAGVLCALWPASTLRRAADLDVRLGLGDRLSTAWAFRDSVPSIVRIQRADAIASLARRSPARDLVWRPTRLEIGVLAASVVLAGILLITPSPQQSFLDQQAAEQASVARAADRLDALREEATGAATSLTPEQARRLDELLRQAQAELNRVKTQGEATAVLARTEDQIGQQLADPNADLRDEALAAMSETLAAEPLTRQLGEALQHEDAQAASQALNQLAARADQLSDVERQALSRALQRASNVGRSDSASASALRDAARALAAGESPSGAMSASEAALRDAIQAANGQASLKATTQRLRDLQAQLASGALPRNDDDLAQMSANGEQIGSPGGVPLPGGTPVALDNSNGGGLRDPSTEPAAGAGVSGADVSSQGQAGLAAGAAAENVFVPGRPGNGPADQDLTDQPFTVRGAPRPYREVLGQYAQTGRDYVDRPDVSPAVRDLVKQYFLQLEEGQ